MRTLGEIVDAVMKLSLEEQKLLVQMLESRQYALQQPSLPIQTSAQKPSTELFEDGRLTYDGIQGIMDELNATLDQPNQL